MKNRALILSNLLKSLLKTTKYSEITIINLCHKANITRQNFYYYFSSLEDCLMNIFKFDNPFVLEEVSNIKMNIKSLFTYIYKNRDFLLNILENVNANNVLKTFLNDDLRTTIKSFIKNKVQRYEALRSEDYQLLVDYYSNAFLSVILDYISLPITRDVDNDVEKFFFFIDGDIQRSVDKLLKFGNK